MNPFISWISLIIQALPRHHRKVRFIRYLRAAFKPLRQLYDIFMEYRRVSLFRLRYRVRVIYIEHMLNSLFNGGLPAYTAGVPTGIWIGPGQVIYDPTFIYRKSENIPIDKWVFKKSETVPPGVKTIRLYRRSEIQNLDWDYTINVPFSVGDVTTDIELFNQIKAWAMTKRPAGKTFKIINY